MLRRTLIQDSKHVVPRVADVDHQRLGRLVRQRDVCRERADLILAWRVHAEVVETALPDPDDERVVQQLLDASGGRRVEGVRVVRMHAGRGEHTLERLGELERTEARFHVHADADQPVDADGLRSLDHICRFAVEEEQVAVGVHRAWLHRQFRVPVAHERRLYSALHMRSRGGASRETRSWEVSLRSGRGGNTGSGSGGWSRDASSLLACASLRSAPASSTLRRLAGPTVLRPSLFLGWVDPGEEAAALRGLRAGLELAPLCCGGEVLVAQGLSDPELFPQALGGAGHDRRRSRSRGCGASRRSRRGRPRARRALAGSFASFHGSFSTRYWFARATMSQTAPRAGWRLHGEHVLVVATRPRRRSPRAGPPRPRRRRARGRRRRSSSASIASTRLARFPRPFARSALWRSTIDSHEKLAVLAERASRA